MVGIHLLGQYPLQLDAGRLELTLDGTHDGKSLDDGEGERALAYECASMLDRAASSGEMAELELDATSQQPCRTGHVALHVEPEHGCIQCVARGEEASFVERKADGLQALRHGKENPEGGEDAEGRMYR